MVDMYKLASKREVMKEYEAIFEHSYDGLFITDGAGVALRVNPAYERITGIAAQEVIGKNMQALITNKTYDQSVSLLVLAKKKCVTIQQKIKGNKKILVTGTPILDEAGEIFRVVTNVRDVTELADLHEQLNESKKQSQRYKTEINYLRSTQLNNQDVIFRSNAITEVIAVAIKVADVNSTVLITGESGTGKEVVAKLIHQKGKSVKQPFIKINCAAVPESLLESELFGYEYGAFTGAKKEGKAGLFELANNGTLFLDEIGDMSPSIQVKLLRALQEREIMRVGGTKPIKINVRIIAATNRDLLKMIEQGTFRDDLYYRLMVVPIYLPPLRERRDDILPLITHFLQKFNKAFDYNKNFSPRAVQYLLEYGWPGNIRELENVIERIVVTSEADEISVDELPNNLIPKVTFLPKKGKKIKETIDEVERFLLQETYKELKSWDKVAVELGINRATVYRKARFHDLLK